MFKHHLDCRVLIIRPFRLSRRGQVPCRSPYHVARTMTAVGDAFLCEGISLEPYRLALAPAAQGQILSPTLRMFLRPGPGW